MSGFVGVPKSEIVELFKNTNQKVEVLNLKFNCEMTEDDLCDIMFDAGFERCQNCDVWQPFKNMIEESDGYCENCC